MNTTASVMSRAEPPRARCIRVTLTASQAEIERQMDWSDYAGRTTVESYELVEAARIYQGTLGPRTKPARYRAVFVVDFPAHTQSERAAAALCGVIRGLGGSVEEL